MTISKKIHFYRFLVLCLIFIGLTSSISLNTTTSTTINSPLLEIKQDEDSFESIKTLAIIGTGFGYSYFWIKDLLESWGCNVTTAGTTEIVQSCPHQPPRPVTVNITISEVTQEIIKQFDIVWVPAGPHWTYLVPNPTVHNILSMAHEEGLVVGSICIGTLILAHANGIVDGVKVVYYSGSFEKMTEENAIIVHNTNVVSDKKIVTAGTGQYQTTNYAIYPFCVAMTKAVLGHSSVISTTFTSITSETNTNHSITVSTTNLSSIYYGNVSTTITSVKAILNSENVNLHNKIYTLTDDDEDGIFERNFTLTENDNFAIDLEVKSLAWGVESVRSVQIYSTESLAPDYLIPIFILSMSITTYLFIIRKKKKNEIA